MLDKREQIEDVATKAIKKDGIRSVSFRTLADEVDVKSASVHYHFPKKSDLAHAVVVRYTDTFADVLADIDRQHRTLNGKLGAFIGVFEQVLRDGELCLCGMMASEVSSLDAATQQALGDFFARVEEWLEHTLRTHNAELALPLSTPQAAKVLLASLEGAILLDRVDGGTQRLAAIHALATSILR